ncbi:D-aminoacyl-tRNA deacylase, partial [Gammaproteobacteria bacterium]|nr:D-aminoacyl-tRNA deacylase [Gammaproteobacteria bacterium]
MQALVQRVLSAEIEIQDQLHARIESGLLAFICFEPSDSIQTLDSFIKKIENFYFFDDDSNVMSTSLKEIDAELMI